MNNVDFSGLLPARALRCSLRAWLPDPPLIVNDVNNSTKSVPIKLLTQSHQNSVWFRVADITNSSFSSGWGIPAWPRASRVSPFTSPSAQKYEEKQILPRERQDTECMLVSAILALEIVVLGGLFRQKERGRGSMRQGKSVEHIHRKVQFTGKAACSYIISACS